MAGSTIMAQEEDSVAELALDLGAIYNRDRHHYLNESVCPLWLLGAAMGTTQTSTSLSFLTKSLPPMIKWIPRAARQHCASLLTRIIQALISNPNNLLEWEYLLIFGRHILHRPARSSSKRNLTNILAQRCRTFTEALSKKARIVPSISLSGNAIGGGRRGDATKAKDGWAMAKVVSAKLEEGNYKGAVRLLTSEDAVAVPSADTLQELHDKHPPIPFDRRHLPSPSNPSPGLSFEEGSVRKAILSFPPGSSGGVRRVDASTSQGHDSG